MRGYVGAALVVKTLQAIEARNCPSTPQLASNELKDAPKIFKEICKIDWNKPVDEVFNLIRGLSPYPAAFTTLISGDEEIVLKIYKAKKISLELNSESGAIHVADRILYVKCEYGWLEIVELQMAGKKRMDSKSFLLGFSLDGYKCT